ncbi:MAG: glycosyltransferase [Planctomycetota bacterium]
MATRPPAVSFVVPVYNAGRYLRAALASLRWQTVTDWEAVCVNDGSTDDSASILRDFAASDARFRIVSQPNGGIVSALNAGVEAARGEWIARMDADDLSMPDRLQRQLATIGPDTSLVGGGIITIDPDGDPLRTQRFPTEHADIESELLAGRPPIAHPTVLLRRDAVLAAGGYRSAFEWIEDIDLWLRLAERGRLTNLPEPVLHYRLHTGSVCWSRRAEQDRLRHALLAEAHQRRGLSPPEPKAPKQPRPLSDPRGKWARQAARAGRWRTAWKWSRQLLAEKPFNPTTARVLAESFLRCGVAVATGKRDQVAPLPDWREWDVPRDRAAAA